MVINIVMACNDSYADPLCVSLHSLISEKKPSDEYNIFVFSVSLSKKSEKHIMSQVAHDPSVHIKFHKLTLDESFGTCPWITAETYLRIYAPQILTSVDKFLYLDCDTIVLDDLAKLFEIDLGNYLVAGVCDYRFDGTYSERILKIPTSQYINAGVLLINASLWRKESVTETCISFLRSHPDIEAYDQDAINFAAKDRIIYLDKLWNFQQVWPENFNTHKWHAHFRQLAHISTQESFHFTFHGIIHYVCEEKPWDFPKREFAQLFWRNAGHTNRCLALIFRSLPECAIKDITSPIRRMMRYLKVVFQRLNVMRQA